MKIIKKIGTILLTGMMIAGASATAYAVTPQYRPPHTDFTIEEVVNAVKDYLKEHPIDTDISGTKLDKPQIVQAIFYHKKLFFNRARLRVRWEAVLKADHYEIRITKKNGESKIYKDSDTALFIYEDSDSFMTDCVRSGKVEVRACGKNGTYSSWSEKTTISCNSLHWK